MGLLGSSARPGPTPGAMMWLAGVGAAISMKLTSSIDDVVWLAPFLTHNESSAAKATNTAIYIAVCLTQTVVAMVIAYSGDSLVSMLTRNSEDAWSSEKILTVSAGGLLALYSVKLGYDYFMEDGEGENDTEEVKYNKVAVEEAAPHEDAEAQKVPLSQRGHTNDSAVDSTEESDAENQQKLHDSSRTQTLFVIAFLGSVDDLTLFVPMLVGKGFDMIQLVVGGFIAASIIVALCVFVGLCKPIADCLSAVPLAAIVITFAVMLLVKGFMLE